MVWKTRIPLQKNVAAEYLSPAQEKKKFFQRMAAPKIPDFR